MLSQTMLLLLTLFDAPPDRIPVILFAMDGFSATQRTFMALSGQLSFADCKGDFNISRFMYGIQYSGGAVDQARAFRR